MKLCHHLIALVLTHWWRNCYSYSSDRLIHCYDGSKPSHLSYNGTLSVTRDGRTCQYWNRLTPHNETRNMAGNFPSGLPDHNYCRNPDRRTHGPWCYSTDPDVLYGYCDVPYCRVCTQCPQGYQQQGSGCYKSSKASVVATMKYLDAVYWCKLEGGNLVEPVSEQKQQEMIDFTNGEQFWISLYQEADRQWIWRSGHKLNVTMWDPADNTNVKDTCATSLSYKWKRVDCDTRVMALCQHDFKKPELRHSVHVLDGGELHLTCHITNVTGEKQFIFYENGVPLNTASTSLSYVINSAVVSQHHNYTCRYLCATLESPDSDPVEIKVLPKTPTIRADFSGTVIVVHTYHHLTCSTASVTKEGTPVLYRFYKNRIPTSARSSNVTSYLVPTYSPEPLAAYTCTASIGGVTSLYSLEINVKVIEDHHSKQALKYAGVFTIMIGTVILLYGYCYTAGLTDVALRYSIHSVRSLSSIAGPNFEERAETETVSVTSGDPRRTTVVSGKSTETKQGLRQNFTGNLKVARKSISRAMSMAFSVFATRPSTTTTDEATLSSSSEKSDFSTRPQYLGEWNLKYGSHV